MNYQQSKRILFALLVLGLNSHFSTTAANDWPHFRGPNGNGTVEKIQHPLTWSDDKNVAWKIKLDGGGLSSPIIVGERILVTSAVGADLPKNFAGGVSNMRPMRPSGKVKFQADCYDLKTGKRLWSKVLTEERPQHPIHSSNSFATETPASDGKRFYVYFSAVGKVFGLDFDGNQVWEKSIGAFPTGNGFGPGSSMTTGEGLVFVQCDNDRESFLLALDGATGNEKWKRKRQGRTSWSTPLLWKNDNRSELVACGSGYVTSHDPKTGELNWKLSGIRSAFSASPASDKNRIYFGNSGPRSSGPLVSVDSKMTGEQELKEGEGDGSVVWSRSRSGPGMSSPVTAGDYLYIPSRGILSCYNSKTGEQVYKERLPLKSTAASMWGDKNVVFLMDENGKCVAIKSGPKFEIVETNQINDQFWSTPSISGNNLLLRGQQTLYCVRSSAESQN